MFPFCWGPDETPMHGPVTESQAADLVDRKTVDLFIPELRKAMDNATNQPFFAMVGFYKPHLPWIAPATSFDEIDATKDDFEPQEFDGPYMHFNQNLFGFSPLVGVLLRASSLWSNVVLQQDAEMRRSAAEDTGRGATGEGSDDDTGRRQRQRQRRLDKEIDGQKDDLSKAWWRYLVEGDVVPISNGVLTSYSRDQPMSREAAVMMRKAYHATIHWCDVLIGEIVDTLEADPAVANNTVIVFTSDHGFSLGERNLWQKNSLYEEGTHVPLFVRLPPSFGPTGMVPHTVSRPTELVDIIPTLLTLARIEIPSTTSNPAVAFNFSGVPLFNASGHVVEFGEDRKAYSFTLKCHHEAHDMCPQAESIRQTLDLVLILAAVLSACKVLAVVVLRRRASSGGDTGDGDGGGDGEGEGRGSSLTPAADGIAPELTTQAPPCRVPSASPEGIIDGVSFLLLVLAFLGWAVGRAILPPPYACTFYNGRWGPEQTVCDKNGDIKTIEHKIVSCADYIGVSVRTDDERYIAWFNTTYLSADSLPMEEEFFPGGGAATNGHAPANKISKKKYRARADELLPGVLAMLTETASSGVYEPTCDTVPYIWQ